MKMKLALLSILLAVAPVMATYTQVYNSTEVGWAVQDSIGALFAGLADNASLIVIIVIGLFAIGGFATILGVLKSMGKHK